MINFNRQNFNNINFTGLKVPNPSSSFITKIKDTLQADIFYKKNNIPKSITQDNIDEKTFIAARNFVMKSVRSLHPKESMAVINNGVIADLKVCKAHSGAMSAKAYTLACSPYNNVVLIHSHPKTIAKSTCPPSIGDWQTLNGFPGIKSMYVINPDGEYAILRKVGEKLSDDETDKALGRFMLGYIDYIGKIDSPICAEAVELFNYGADLALSGAEPSVLVKRFGSLIENIDHAGLTVEYVHNFWKKYAGSMNLTYETNFSKLI